MTKHKQTHQCACGQPAPDTTICATCRTRLARDLQSVPGLLADLYLVLGREIHYHEHAGGQSANAPLPYNPDTSHLLWVLRNTLTAWARVLGARTADTTAAAHHLRARLDTLALHGDAEQAADEIGWILTQARRATDKPAYSRRWVGHCPQATPDWCCTGELYALVPADENKPAFIECNHRCGDPWSTSMWARLGRRLQRCPRCRGRCTPTRRADAA